MKKNLVITLVFSVLLFTGKIAWSLTAPISDDSSMLNKTLIDFEGFNTPNEFFELTNQYENIGVKFVSDSLNHIGAALYPASGQAIGNNSFASGRYGGMRFLFTTPVSSFGFDIQGGDYAGPLTHKTPFGDYNIDVDSLSVRLRAFDRNDNKLGEHDFNFFYKPGIPHFYGSFINEVNFLGLRSTDQIAKGELIYSGYNGNKFDGGYAFDNFKFATISGASPVVTPEPISSLLMLAGGGTMLGQMALRRRKKT